MDDLLNRAPCGFIAFTDDGTITLANATLAGMLGLATEELVGRSVETILTLPSRIFYQTHIFPLLRIEEEVREVYITLRGPDGEIPVLLNAARRNLNGKLQIECIVVEMRRRGEYENAILEAKRAAEAATRERDKAIERLQDAQQEVEAQREELEQMNVRLRRSMTETHHRVKNNLQIICALIEMQTDEGRETVPISEWTRIEKSVRALSAIHDILTQEAKSGGDQETISSREVLQKLIGLLSLTTGERVIHSDLQDSRLEPRQATGLALLTNEIISNALKHSRSDIWIQFRVQDLSAHMEVRDDGPGFPPEFDPVTAANTGLDLIESVVRWDLSGEVRYENQPTGGACVSIRFPLRALVEAA
jgi:PAS domain S-box-containing protein